MKLTDIRSEFGVYDNNPDLAYFDSASTTLVPRAAVKLSSDFLNNTVVSSRKGAYQLAIEGATIVEDSRNHLAQYLGTDPSQVSFQKSLPSAVASLIYGFDWKGEKRNKVVIAKSEENSVLVSVLRAAEVLNLNVDMIPIDSQGSLDIGRIEQTVDDDTGIVAVSHVIPGIGAVNPIDKVSKIVHNAGAILLTDVTRSAGLTDFPLVNLGSDILLFSANIGLMGPPGLALQWMKSPLNEKYRPGILGGSSVSNVDELGYDLALPPDRFESDMLNIPAIAGLKASITFLNSIEGTRAHLAKISRYMLERLGEIENLVLYGSPNEHSTIFGFNIRPHDELSSHDIALFLAEANIAVRSGLICAHPLIQSVSGYGLVQASIHIYNTIADIEHLGDTLEAVVHDFL